MTYFEPKRYQDEVLDSAHAYFDACHSEGNAATAFSKATPTSYGKKALVIRR